MLGQGSHSLKDAQQIKGAVGIQWPITLTPSSQLHVQEEVLLAFQVCFDLFENEMQAFLMKVIPCAV